MSSLLVNLTALMDKPTGISVYAQNVIPFLQPLNPVICSEQTLQGFDFQQAPSGLSPQAGSRGHARRLWWLQTGLPRQYRNFGANLIFSPLPEAPLYSGCRFVVTVHDIIPLRFPRQFSAHLVAYFRYYVRQVVLQAEHVICDSAATAQDLVDFYAVKASKLTPVVLAYDQHHFQPQVTKTQNYFLYVGRQDPHKNLHGLIDAFGQVSRQQDDLELWLVGPEDRRYTPRLVSRSRSLGIERKVKCLDYVAYDDLPKLLGGAIALVMPSLWEGFGLPVLEAMACGTPVITSNLSSLPEVAGEAAILVDPYSIDHLAAAMLRLLQEGQLRSQLRQAGLARAKQFSWAKTGKATAEVLQRFM